MVQKRAPKHIPATHAHELADITYRQLDYWARRGWVTPSIDQGLGRAGRRLYSADDVVRLAALGHFGRSGLDIAKLGPVVARLTLPATDFLVVVSKDADEVSVVARDRLRAAVAAPGMHAVFDPAPLRARLASAGSRESEVRSA